MEKSYNRGEQGAAGREEMASTHYSNSLISIHYLGGKTMYNLVPTNMQEVADKLAYELSKGKDSTEESVIRRAVLDNAQQMLDGALEGPYWKALWQEEDRVIVIQDIMNKPVGTVLPAQTDFISDFRESAPSLLQKMADQIQKIVDND